MTERGGGNTRGSGRGGGGARGGGGGGGGRGGRGGGRAGGDDKPKREAILDLAKYVDARVRVKFTGGREVTGLLKGYDQLLNLVMDEVVETLPATEAQPTPSERSLGLVILRGTSIVIINPVEGSGEIANPFVQPA